MEPPPKRRRHGKSPLDSTDTEDDELGFEPHEVLARRDPAYKLSLDRAYADNRFQSTMAHIFEKYGRDFEGIGDEIDMMTGEIVVNNGHLQNMRSETDVGLRNGNEEAEEDEGILLDELTDDEPDGLLMGPGQCHKAGQEAAEQEAEQEDEDDRILHGHAPSRTSTSLVAFRRPQAPPILPPTTIAPGLLGTRHLPFTPPFSFGGSPLALGISPLDMRSLGLFGSHMAPLEPPDIFPGPSRLLPTPGERYDFLERNGGSSIWAPSYQFKDNEPDGAIQPLRQPPARRTRRMKYIAPSASKGLNEDVDDDIILAGKNFGHDQGSSLSETHERLKDELLITGDAPSSEPSRKPRKRGRPVTRTKSVSHTPQQQQHEKAATQTKKGSTELLSERSTSNGNIPITSREHVEFVADDQGDSTAKQPRHAEQQARFPDKRPRNHAHGGRRRQYKLEVQIPAVDPSRLAEYMAIEDAVKFVADSADEASNNSVSPETEEIPEPQDASTKVNSGVSTSKLLPGRGRREVGTASQATMNSAYILSDDEMPIFFKQTSTSDRKVAKDRIAQRPLPHAASPEREDAIATEKAAVDDKQLVSPRATVCKSVTTTEAAIQKRVTMLKNEQTERIRRLLDEVKNKSTVSNNDAPAFLSRDLLQSTRRQPGPRMEISAHPSKKSSGSRAPRHGGSSNVSEQVAPREEPQVSDETEKGQRRVVSTSVMPPEPATSPIQAPPRKPTAKPSSPICPTPSRPLCTPSKPQTPGHRCIPITRAPSSRRSILSLLSPDPALPVDGADEERDLDELVGLTDVLSTSFLSDSAAPWSSKIWKSSALTTEIYHTPVKKRPTDAVSPGSVIRTPGGTIRSCGINGYRCGRDFCFTCL
ncbi:hypothetical protein DCS_06113 [Drechmeria coniospora]|uniref:Myb-like DNA-binding domain protein n=1 Tax=Drechmeria coniospora TaxID=98403 RepID=A0A151GAN2_DRECN|nr:hypothetical protein DCS_06113 [Drechmeria coniospora]KYK54156.1 hypothetical protein DCS_06113 [Drechmeria coniospora]